ncbi:MAG: PD-(D/E)XK nuclease family protein, partial [Acidobacteria bacterium]|nr:PD-(D/E)XK nuclease family protein [Candidatus Polarisedimenticola svalbardensis]
RLPRHDGASRDEAKELGTAVHVALENWNSASGSPHSNNPDALKLLQDFETGPLGKLFREIEIVGREVPMLMQDDGFAWRGSIDLLYRDGDELVVADFKTDAGIEPDEAKERYGGQLKRYAEAVAKATEKPVRTELWMVRSGEIIRIPQ